MADIDIFDVTFQNVNGLIVPDGQSNDQIFTSPPMVQGTFTIPQGDGSLNLNIPYAGDGYPVAVLIAPVITRYDYIGNFFNVLPDGATAIYMAYKDEPLIHPDLQGIYSLSNSFTIVNYYSDSGTPAVTSAQELELTGPNGSWSSDLFFLNFNESLTIMYVQSADGGYGFAEDVAYQYRVVYSADAGFAPA